MLSGCGVLDGSEIHEAVSVLVHLSRAGVETRMFAPDVEQSDVINHVKGSGTGMSLWRVVGDVIDHSHDLSWS